MKDFIDRVMARVEQIDVPETSDRVMPAVRGCVRMILEDEAKRLILEDEAKRSHDVKELAVFRSFFERSTGHGSRMTEEGTRFSEAERAQIEAIEARDEFILAFGTLPEDAAILAHAESKWKAYDPDRTFDELPERVRGSWIRRSKLDLVTFEEDLYRRLADVTARETVGVGFDAIRSDDIRKGWIRSAEIALHIPPRFWDTQYLVQNSRGMRKMLLEKSETSER